MRGIWHDNTNTDLKRCRASASRNGFDFHQCNRKPVIWRAVEGFEGELGFCYQHDPVQQQKQRNRKPKLIVGRERRVKKSICSSCGYRLDGASSVGKRDHKPKPGDVSVCIKCGHLAAFNADMTLRELNDAEMVKIAGDPYILAIQRARKLMQDTLKDLKSEKDAY